MNSDESERVGTNPIGATNDANRVNQARGVCLSPYKDLDMAHNVGLGCIHEPGGLMTEHLLLEMTLHECIGNVD
jgi:hypothetical protein